MGIITDADNTWRSRTLAAKEMWQCQDGVVFVDTEANAELRRGVRLKAEQALEFASGLTVYYRLASGTSAIIGYTAH